MAGGNGNENLDHPIYNTPGAGFPPSNKFLYNQSMEKSI
jgi:hypothetical protein